MSAFRKMCDEIAPVSYIFDTDNNASLFRTNNAKITVRYSDVSFMFSPNRICFTNEKNVLCINRVKTIYYQDYIEGVSRVFEIVCKNPDDENQDIIYTIIADK